MRAPMTIWTSPNRRTMTAGPARRPWAGPVVRRVSVPHRCLAAVPAVLVTSGRPDR
jgi:hypothetical protein